MTTEAEYRAAFSDVYWEMRDIGLTTIAAHTAADVATQPLLDELEDA